MTTAPAHRSAATEDIDAARVSPDLIAALVLARLLLPLLTLHPAWDFHRDEMLYFAMGDHLDLLRMQFPPMIAVIAATGHALFGESVLAARVPAAFGGAALTAIVLLLVRRLRGGRAAVLLAWLALLAAPVFMRPSVLMHPVIFDQVWSTLAIAALTLAAHEREPRWWLLVGAALGLGALTKFSIAFIGVSVAAAALLDSELRSQLRGRWPWVALLLATVLAMPSISGQMVHSWPFVQQMQALRSGQLEQVSATGFLREQPMLLSAALMCAIPGFLAALRSTARDRVPVVAALVMLALMLVMHGKGYYAAPVYPVVIAIGALKLERLSRARRWLTPVAGLTMAAGSAVLWPVGVPVFGPQRMIAYHTAIGLGQSAKTNLGEPLELSQDYADMLGWRTLADSVGAVVQRLPAASRADITLIASNYGEAGALAFYRDRARIPYPRSTAGDFWAWGPGPTSGNDVIVTGAASVGDILRTSYDTVEVASTTDNPLGVPEERKVFIYHARGARATLATMWPKLGPNWN